MIRINLIFFFNLSLMINQQFKFLYMIKKVLFYIRDFLNFESFEKIIKYMQSKYYFNLLLI